MEAELLTVLGRIPAPEDRDVATQLANIERSPFTTVTIQSYRMMIILYTDRRRKSVKLARKSFRKEDLSSPGFRPSLKKQS